MHGALWLMIYYSTLYTYLRLFFVIRSSQCLELDLSTERTTRIFYFYLLFAKRTSHFLHFGDNAHLPQANGKLGLTFLCHFCVMQFTFYILPPSNILWDYPVNKWSSYNLGLQGTTVKIPTILEYLK